MLGSLLRSVKSSRASSKLRVVILFAPTLVKLFSIFCLVARHKFLFLSTVLARKTKDPLIAHVFALVEQREGEFASMDDLNPYTLTEKMQVKMNERFIFKQVVYVREA